MPIAAVPYYVGQDFKDASPGMRFGMYLQIWTNRTDQEAEINNRASRKSREAQELREHIRRNGMDTTIREWTKRGGNPVTGLWEKNDHSARHAWQSITRLANNDRILMKALLERQSACASVHSAANNLIRIDALAIAPFATGLGNEHPLENGFAFLNPYGLPYLSGSGVKGVLRQAARELASGEWGERVGWSNDQSYTLRLGNNSIPLTMIDVLFGRETQNGDSDHVRGVLSFWDVIPQITGENLHVEIMTPHQTDYYQNGLPPHESGQPTPISFLTIPPGSGFTFHVLCDLRRLEWLDPNLVKDDQWKKLLQAAFTHAFDWLGFGAKTAVGYGAMRGAHNSSHSPGGMRQSKSEQSVTIQTTEIEWPAARLTFNPGMMAITAFYEGKTTTDLKGQAAQDFLAALGENAVKLKKKKELKNIAVKVECKGNLIVLKGLV